MRLTASELAGERGGETIFAGVSFALESGQSLLVTGPNGSGKSTLLRLIAGLLAPAGGRLTLEGEANGRPLGEACHYLGHQDAMKTALTVGENLAFWRNVLGDSAQTVDEALDAVGLPDVAALPFGFLSAGQKRRVAIARLLVSHRAVWLLDEPTAGLDGASQTRLTALVNSHLATGGIVVVATHQPLGLQGARELAMGTLPAPSWAG